MRKTTAKPVYMYDMWGDLVMGFKRVESIKVVSDNLSINQYNDKIR